MVYWIYMFYYDLLTENPCGLWTLDSNASGLFTDESGMDRDASSTGTLSHVEPVTAGGAAALRLSGSTTVSFPLPDTLRQGKETRSAAMEFWFKTENTAGSFLFRRNSEGISITDNDLTVSFGGNTVLAENVIETGFGHHIVVLYNSAAIMIYVDNALVASGDVLDPDFSNMTSPNMVASVTGGRVATIDTVVFYNYTLASNAIYQHYLNAQSFIPAQNTSQGNGSIRFEFDDLHLPVARRTTELLGFCDDKCVIRDNEIHLIYNAESTPLFPTGVYTQIIQFDDVETGTATNARVDWEVDGDPDRVTVESSANGTSWAPVTNHGLTTNLTGSITSEDFFIRVTIAGGDTDVAVWGLEVTLYKGMVYTSSDTGVTATLNGSGLTGYYDANPSQFRNREGVRLTGGYLAVSTHTDFGTVGAVELLLNPLTQATGTFYAKGSSRIYRDGTGVHFSGFDRLVVNGVNIANNDTTITPTPGWKHVVATFTTPNTGVSYIGATTTGTEIVNPLQVGYFVMHSRKLTLAEAQSLYKNFVGGAPVRIMAGNTTTIREHAFDNGSPVKIYAFDWAISGAGGLE